MATWKKVIVSGSSPSFASITKLDTDLAIAHGGTGASSATAAATALGIGTGDSPQFTAVNIGHATDTTVARASGGDIAVEGNIIYRAGGTDVPLTDGGTGASSAAAAATNLGVGAASAVTHGSLTVTGNVTGSITSTGSFGMLVGDGAGITNLTSAAISTYTNGSTADRIITSTGASGVNAESTLTFDGTRLNVTGNVTASAGFTGSFSGDGSALTGVTQDIDNLDEFSGVPHATNDEFLISNSGVEERATMTMLANGVFAIASDSGDATIGADGGITIAAGSVDDGMLSDGVAAGLAGAGTTASGGEINVVGGAGITAGADAISLDLNGLGVETTLADGDFVAVVDTTDGGSQKITFSNFEDQIFSNVTAGNGDVTIAAGGEASIGATKVTDAMINDDVATNLAGTGLTSAVAGVLGVIGGDGITVGANEVEVTVDDSTIGLNNTNGAGAVFVKNAGIGHVQIAAATLASQGGLTGGAGTAISVDFTHTKFTGGSPTFAGMTVTGDLTVQGTTTTLDTQNLLVEDNFIFAATGSAGAPGVNLDGGLIVQSGSADKSGSAMMHDISAQRWAVAKSIGASAGSGSGAATVVPSAFVSTVQIDQATAPGATSGSYGEGEMYITQADDIWIRVG